MEAKKLCNFWETSTWDAVWQPRRVAHPAHGPLLLSPWQPVRMPLLNGSNLQFKHWGCRTLMWACRILISNGAPPEVFLIRLLYNKLFCEQKARSLPPREFLCGVSKIPPQPAVMKARSHHIPCDIPCWKQKQHAVASPETRACFLVEQNQHYDATQNAVTIWSGWLLPCTTCIIHAFSSMEVV